MITDDAGRCMCDRTNVSLHGPRDHMLHAVGAIVLKKSVTHVAFYLGVASILFQTACSARRARRWTILPHAPVIV